MINKFSALESYQKRAVVLILLSTLLIFPVVKSWNDGSRMATIQSIVEYGTLAIDDSVFLEGTGDKIFVDGHFYPDKPLFPSVFGAIIYWPLYQMGIELNTGFNLVYFWVTFLSLKIFWVWGLKAFYDVLGYTDLNNDKFRMRITLALAFASLYFSWSGTFNNHIFAAAHMILGMNFYLKAKHHKENIARNLFLAGLFISLAGVEELSDSLFYIGFFILVLIDVELRKKIWAYVVPVVLTVLPTLIMYYEISGSFLPVTINHELYNYPGSPWAGTNPNMFLSGHSTERIGAILIYYFNGLLGTNGFILYNPFLFIAIPALVGEIREKRKLKNEALVIGIISVIIAIYYLSMNNDHGGGSFGVRWFVVFLPLYFIFLYRFFENFNEKKEQLFLHLFIVSLLVSVIGLSNPWSDAGTYKSSIVANALGLLQFIISLFRAFI